MPSTTTYRQRQVVVVNVPFPDQTGAKRRPALVVSTEAFHSRMLDMIVCPISSQQRYFQKPGPGDCPLSTWQAVGLQHPSTARLGALLAVEKALVQRVLGTLKANDWERVAAGLRRAFGL